jgi:hypothetical protein
MATTTMPAPEAQAPINHFGRLTGVLFSPKQTFSDIAQRPSWVAPFVLLCALSLTVGVLLGQKTDWRGFFERQMSQNSRFDQMSQEQKDNILERQTTWAPKISFAFGLVGAALTILLMTLVYWGAFNLFRGAGLGFGTSLGITAHAFVASCVGSLLAIVILLLKPRGDVDPEHFLASNVAAFLPDGAPHWLAVLGQSIEVFWIWSLALIAIGFAAANPKKIKPAASFGIVFGIWAVWVLAKVAWAAI